MTNKTGKWWFERHETKNEIFVRWLEDSAPRFGPIDLLAPSENVSHKVKVKLIDSNIYSLLSVLYTLHKLTGMHALDMGPKRVLRSV